MNALGIWSFAQIAGWSAANAQWVGTHLRFSGRIERELWSEQARLLGAGVETGHARAIRQGSVRIDAALEEPLSDSDAQALRHLCRRFQPCWI